MALLRLCESHLLAKRYRDYSAPLNLLSLPSFFSDEGVPRVMRRSPDAKQTISSFDPSPPCCYKAVHDPPPGAWSSLNVGGNATSTRGKGQGRRHGRPYCVEPDSFKLKGQTSMSMSYSSQPAGSGYTSSSSSPSSSSSSSSLPSSTPVHSGMPYAFC